MLRFVAFLIYFLFSQACKQTSFSQNKAVDDAATHAFHWMGDGICLSIDFESKELTPEKKQEIVNKIVEDGNSYLAGPCPNSAKLSNGEPITLLKQCLPLKRTQEVNKEGGLQTSVTMGFSFAVYDKWMKDNVVRQLPNDSNKLVEFCNRIKADFYKDKLSLTGGGLNLSNMKDGLKDLLEEP